MVVCMVVVLPHKQVLCWEVGGMGDADAKVTMTSGDLYPGHQPPGYMPGTNADAFYSGHLISPNLSPTVPDLGIWTWALPSGCFV